MKLQKIHNNHLKIETIAHQTFLPTEHETYEEIGTVIAKDEAITKVEIGELVYFDSWMCKKYPVLGEDEKFHWLVPYDQIVMSERDQEED